MVQNTLSELACLALTIFLEGRSEPIGAQYQIGSVIMNRTVSEEYPDTICEVVKQPNQFATKINDPGTKQERDIAMMVAMDLYYNYIPDPNILWFYDPSKVNPGWAKNLEPVGKIGTHLFLRKP